MKATKLLCVSGLLLTACSTGGSDAPDPEAAVCAVVQTRTNADGDRVQVCDELHAERPFVRPPADDRNDETSVTLFVAAEEPDMGILVDREGTRYRMLVSGAEVTEETLPSEVHGASYRMLFTIYEVTGAIDDAVGDEEADLSLDVRSMRPAIMITGQAIDSAFLGPWEGQVSVRVPDAECTLTVPCWSYDEHTPLRVDLSTIEPLDDMGVLSLEPPLLEDGDRHLMRGKVENMDSSVMSSGGECLPAITSVEGKHPFHPAQEAELSLFRFPGMHAPGDLVLVMDYPEAAEGVGGANGMSGLTTLHPVNLIQTEERDGWSRIAIHNHGVPNGLVIDIRPVSGGGEPC
jgi:hypothetical protein